MKFLRIVILLLFSFSIKGAAVPAGSDPSRDETATLRLVLSDFGSTDEFEAAHLAAYTLKEPGSVAGKDGVANDTQHVLASFYEAKIQSLTRIMAYFAKTAPSANPRKKAFEELKTFIKKHKKAISEDFGALEAAIKKLQEHHSILGHRLQWPDTTKERLSGLLSNIVSKFVDVGLLAVLRSAGIAAAGVALAAPLVIPVWEAGEIVASLVWKVLKTIFVKDTEQGYLSLLKKVLLIENLYMLRKSRGKDDESYYSYIERVVLTKAYEESPKESFYTYAQFLLLPESPKYLMPVGYDVSKHDAVIDGDLEAFCTHPDFQFYDESFKRDYLYNNVVLKMRATARAPLIGETSRVVAYFYGPSGRGKTFAASAIANYLTLGYHQWAMKESVGELTGPDGALLQVFLQKDKYGNSYKNNILIINDFDRHIKAGRGREGLLLGLLEKSYFALNLGGGAMFKLDLSRTNIIFVANSSPDIEGDFGAFRGRLGVEVEFPAISEKDKDILKPEGDSITPSINNDKRFINSMLSKTIPSELVRPRKGSQSLLSYIFNSISLKSEVFSESEYFVLLQLLYSHLIWFWQQRSFVIDVPLVAEYIKKKMSVDYLVGKSAKLIRAKLGLDLGEREPAERPTILLDISGTGANIGECVRRKLGETLELVHEFREGIAVIRLFEIINEIRLKLITELFEGFKTNRSVPIEDFCVYTQECKEFWPIIKIALDSYGLTYSCTPDELKDDRRDIRNCVSKIRDLLTHPFGSRHFSETFLIKSYLSFLETSKSPFAKLLQYFIKKQYEGTEGSPVIKEKYQQAYYYWLCCYDKCHKVFTDKQKTGQDSVVFSVFQKDYYQFYELFSVSSDEVKGLYLNILRLCQDGDKSKILNFYRANKTGLQQLNASYRAWFFDEVLEASDFLVDKSCIDADIIGIIGRDYDEIKRAPGLCSPGVLLNLLFRLLKQSDQGPDEKVSKGTDFFQILPEVKEFDLTKRIETNAIVTRALFKVGRYAAAELRCKELAKVIKTYNERVGARARAPEQPLDGFITKYSLICNLYLLLTSIKLGGHKATTTKAIDSYAEAFFLEKIDVLKSVDLEDAEGVLSNFLTSFGTSKHSSEQGIRLCLIKLHLAKEIRNERTLNELLEGFYAVVATDQMQKVHRQCRALVDGILA